MARTDQPTEADVINAGVQAALREWQSSFPGIVAGGEQPDGRVLVQPAIRIKVRGGVQATPKPVTIPVAWPSWGPYVIQGKLTIGDEVRVQCQDKNWLAWLQTGGLVDDLGIGGHSAGYAVAVPSKLSLPNRPTPMPPTEVLRIGRLDALTTISLRADGSIALQATDVTLTSGAGLAQFLTTLQTSIAGWVPVVNDGGAALKTALAAWLALTPPTGGGPPPP